MPGESEQVAESRKSCFKPAMKSALGSRREECVGPVKEFLWKINSTTKTCDFQGYSLVMIQYMHIQYTFSYSSFHHIPSMHM